VRFGVRRLVARKGTTFVGEAKEVVRGEVVEAFFPEKRKKKKV